MSPHGSNYPPELRECAGAVRGVVEVKGTAPRSGRFTTHPADGTGLQGGVLLVTERAG
jgi:hypothetical protein